MGFVNPLRAAWSRGEVVRGAWCTAPSPVVTEVVAAVGFDYVCVDMQHGAVDLGDAIGMLQAIRAGGAAPIVRVPANDAAVIGQVLDAGALGVVVPLVSSRAEAERAVAAARYPLTGVRSFGPVRAATVIGSREPDDLEQVVVAVMVETQDGLDRADEIASTPGLDAVYVGPADLALALGLPPAYEHRDPAHARAIQALLETCQRHGVAPGIHCADGAMAARRAAQGFRMVTLANDLALVRSGASAELEQARDPQAALPR